MSDIEQPKIERSLEEMLPAWGPLRAQVWKSCIRLNRNAVFDAVSLHSRTYRPGQRRFLFLDQESRHFDALPRSNDVDMDGYLHRVARESQGSRIFASFRHLERSSRYIWLLGRELAYMFYRQTGTAPVRTFAAAFISNTVTPFGVHNDAYHNFTFVVEGTKRLRTWPHHVLDPYFPNLGANARPKAADYAAHKATSQLLEGDTSDLLYVPENFWHVGEGAESMAVSVAIAVSTTASENLARSFDHRGAFGFQAPAPAREPEDLAARRLAIDRRFPILSSDRDPSTIYANGHRLPAPEGEWVTDMLDAINESAVFLPSELVAKIPGEHQAATWKMLSDLYSFIAIDDADREESFRALF